MASQHGSGHKPLWQVGFRPLSGRFGRRKPNPMTTDLDIYRSAAALIKRYREDALASNGSVRKLKLSWD